jgi:hypothetical protein
MKILAVLLMMVGCNETKLVPNQQSFVYIRTQSIENEKDCEGEDCPLRVMTSSGSGSVIRHHNHSTYVLTAGHVCETSSSSVSTIVAIDSSGNAHNIEKTRYSDDPDLCVVKSLGLWGVPLKFSSPSESLKYGDRVISMSAPNGIFSKNMVPIFSGMYSGDLQNGDNVYTLPAMAGASGSAVLNDNLEIVSVVHSAAKGFQHVAIGTSAQRLDQFMNSTRDFIEK